VIWDFQPRRVIFLGDLFHSEFNRQWMEFCDLLAQFDEISFELIAGNHDVLDPTFYEQAGLKVHLNGLHLHPFLLTHHPLEDFSDTKWYNLAGHLHPGVRLRGNGRQRLRLPCFFFGPRQGLLPAFGEFTGLATLSVAPGDEVFVIVEDEIVRMG
jgi:DNA ligase-associated metallophosphoesterase